MFVPESVTNLTVAASVSTKKNYSWITFIENTATPVHCIARGGSPPPEMEFFLDTADYTNYFRFDSTTSTSGDLGFRSLHLTSMLVTDQFRVTAEDDGKKLICTARVPGLAQVSTSIKLRVHCEYNDVHTHMWFSI